MCFLPLETQKNIAHVFANLARRSGGGAFANVVARDATILAFLTNAFKDDNADFALLCGIVSSAREAIIIHAAVPVIIGSGNLQGTKLLCWLFLTPLTFGIFLR